MEQVAAALACLPGEWNDLTRQAESLGRVVYSRYTHTSSCKAGKVGHMIVGIWALIRDNLFGSNIIVNLTRPFL